MSSQTQTDNPLSLQSHDDLTTRFETLRNNVIMWKAGSVDAPFNLVVSQANDIVRYSLNDVERRFVGYWADYYDLIRKRDHKYYEKVDMTLSTESERKKARLVRDKKHKEEAFDLVCDGIAKIILVRKTPMRVIK